MEGIANATPDQVSTPPAPPPAELSSDELKERLEQIRNGPDVQKDNRTAALPNGTTEAKSNEKPPDQPKPEEALREAQKFNGRLTNELGLARSEIARLNKELLSLKAKAQAPADDPDRAAKNQKFIEDPLGVLDEELEKRDRLKEEQNKANQEEYKTNYQAVTAAIPDVNIDDLMPMMFEVALEDGVPEDVVMEFAKNPWKHDPRSVIALAKRALAEQKLRERDKPAHGAKTDKGTKTGKPFTTLTASSGQSGRDTSPRLTREQLAELSDEELKEYRRQLTKRP